MVAILTERAPDREDSGRRTSEGPDDILAQYLPAILSQDPFLTNFLRVFDSILRPLLGTIDSVDSYLDPSLTPAGFLDWLAGWVGEEQAAGLREAAQRTLLKEAVAIHRGRGTKSALKRALSILTESEALVTENTTGLRLDGDAQLGINTSLEEPESNTIHVTLLKSADEVDLEAVGDLLRKLKPAHASYSLRTTEG